jgi:hypothetical protein
MLESRKFFLVTGEKYNIRGVCVKKTKEGQGNSLKDKRRATELENYKDHQNYEYICIKYCNDSIYISAKQFS